MKLQFFSLIAPVILTVLSIYLCSVIFRYRRHRLKQFERMEEDLRRSHTFLDSVIENIPNMIFVKEAKNLTFVRFNKAGEELLGVPREELVGKSDYDFFPREEADFFTAKDNRVLSQGVLVDIPEEPIHTKHKGVRILHTRKIPILDEKGTPQYLLGISDDITDYRKAAEMLLQKEIELARVQVEKEQLDLFAHVASHDLQEPLHKIVAFGDLFQKEKGTMLDAEGLDYLNRMRSAAKRMSQLIDDILKFSRATHQASAVEPVDLNVVLRDVMEDLELRIEQSQAEVQSYDMPILRASRAQMYELFQNIIGNAIKFGKKSETPQIHIKCLESQDGVRITITDNGIGFDPKYKERIFRPFERLHGRGEYEGSGIGLAICQKIVSRLGGTISADSVPGQGTTFTIELPLSIIVEPVVSSTPL